MASPLASIGSPGPDSTSGFHFLKRSDVYAKQKPYYFSGTLEPDQEARRSNLEYEVHGSIRNRDLRGYEDKLNLTSHGFELLKHEPIVSLDDPNDDEITDYLDDLVKTVKSTSKLR